MRLTKPEAPCFSFVDARSGQGIRPALTIRSTARLESVADGIGQAGPRRLVTIEEFADDVSLFGAVGLGDQPVPEIGFRERVAITEMVAVYDFNAIPDLPADPAILNALDGDEYL